jgi:serine/threonine protein kinase
MSGPIFKEKQKERAYLTEKCDKCQKPITSKSKAGSFTAFLFAANRCSCNTPVRLKVVPTLSGEAIASGSEDNSSAHDKPDLSERYDVLELIGQGGMGAVWKVRDKAINKTLAVKVLRKELATDRLAVKRFEQEAMAAVCLTHANLIAVYGSGTTKDNSPYLIMDFIDGESLADLLQREVFLSVPRVLDITTQICEALAHAHTKGIVHRDLKPSNIMLTKSPGGNDIVKIVDFGIAQMMPSINEQTNNLTQTGDLLGSPLYMSPEQCKGETVDVRSDIYSVGCIMYEMLTGKAIFEAANPIQVILRHINEEAPILPSTQISLSLKNIIAQCLRREPSERYQSTYDLLSDLNNCPSGQEPLATTALGLLTRRVAAATVDAFIVAVIFIILMATAQATLTGFYLAYRSTSVETLIITTSICWFFLVLDNLFRYSIFFSVSAIVYRLFGSPSSLARHSGSSQVLSVFVLPLSIISLNWLYTAMFESSRLRATPGKLLAGLQVTSAQGESLRFSQATMRYFAKTLVPFQLIVFPVLALLKLGNLSSFSAYVASVVSRPIHDHIAGTVVARKRAGGPLFKSSRLQLPALSIIVIVIALTITYFFNSSYGSLPFEKTTWRANPEQRYRMLRSVMAPLKDLTRSEIYSMLGEPDTKASQNRVGWRGSKRTSDNSYAMVIQFKNDRPVEFSVGALGVDSSAPEGADKGKDDH